jgi:hypothetical protein
MQALYLATIVSVVLQSAAFSALGPDVEALNDFRTPIDHAFGPQSVAPPSRLVRNPNECAADHAEPVWSATSTILGSLCASNENGA